MKKFLIFLIGFFVGIITCIVVVTCSGLLLGSFSSEEIEEIVENYNGPQITIFDEPRDCISTKSFQVESVWDNGYALANEQTGKNSYFGGQKVLFMSDKDNAFYDKQIISIPEGMCVKQIGICRYKEIPHSYKDPETIPIVKVLEK